MKPELEPLRLPGLRPAPPRALPKIIREDLPKAGIHQAETRSDFPFRRRLIVQSRVRGAMVGYGTYGLAGKAIIQARAKAGGYGTRTEHATATAIAEARIRALIRDGQTMCPDVTEWPEITYGNTGSIATSGSYDTRRRQLFIPWYSTNNYISVVSTQSNTHLGNFPGLTTTPKFPFSNTWDSVYDPVHDVIVIRDYYGWGQCDPETWTLARTSNRAGGLIGLGRWFLACDTTRGNVIHSDSGRGKFEVTQTSGGGLTSIYASGVVLPTTAGTPAYSDGIDSLLIFNRGGTPPFYYIDPDTFAITPSGIALTGTASDQHCAMAIPGSSLYVFTDSGANTNVVDLSTDTVIFSVKTGQLYMGAAVTSIPCHNVLCLMGSTPVRRYDMDDGFSSLPNVTATVRWAAYDKYAGLFYAVSAATTPGLVFTI